MSGLFRFQVWENLFSRLNFWSGFFFCDFAASCFNFGAVSEFMFAIRCRCFCAVSTNNENAFAFDGYFSAVFERYFFNFGRHNYFSSWSSGFGSWSCVSFFGLCAYGYDREKASSGQSKHFSHSRKSPERCNENKTEGFGRRPQGEIITFP